MQAQTPTTGAFAISGPFAISQEELQYLVFLQNQVRTLRKECAALSIGLLYRLEAGAPVEPGVHIAQAKRTTKSRGYEVRLKIR